MKHKYLDEDGGIIEEWFAEGKKNGLYNIVDWGDSVIVKDVTLEVAKIILIERTAHTNSVVYITNYFEYNQNEKDDGARNYYIALEEARRQAEEGGYTITPYTTPVSEIKAEKERVARLEAAKPKNIAKEIEKYKKTTNITDEEFIKKLIKWGILPHMLPKEVDNRFKDVSRLDLWEHIRADNVLGVMAFLHSPTGDSDEC